MSWHPGPVPPSKETADGGPLYSGIYGGLPDSCRETECSWGATEYPDGCRGCTGSEGMGTQCPDVDGRRQGKCSWSGTEYAEGLRHSRLTLSLTNVKQKNTSFPCKLTGTLIRGGSTGSKWGAVQYQAAPEPGVYGQVEDSDSERQSDSVREEGTSTLIRMSGSRSFPGHV